MAHQIEGDDKMFSVNEKPWHGLGVVLADYPDVMTAAANSGLYWRVTKAPIYILTGNGSPIQVQNQWATVREDTGRPLGVVGDRYEPFQNFQSWEFIERFLAESQAKLETAGSLQGGRKTWVLAKNGNIEYLSGDTVEKYFLFFNSFDGSKAIQVLFTDVRVVCNNTLSIALGRNKNSFNIRHTDSAKSQLAEIKEMLGYRSLYEKALEESYAALIQKQMADAEIKRYLEEVLFAPPKVLALPASTGAIPAEALFNQVDFSKKKDEESKRAETIRQGKIEKVLELVEVGQGANIPGVRGTAYGVMQAVAEYADHYSTIRETKTTPRPEQRFTSILCGSANELKTQAMNSLLAA